MKNKLPMLFVGGQETAALKLLRQASNPEGYALPYFRKQWSYQRPYMTMQAMAQRGWVIEKRSGPKGGKRWHLTDLGEVLMKAIDQYGPRYMILYSLAA